MLNKNIKLRNRCNHRKNRLHQLYTIKKGCPDCGIKGPREIYQFDHTDGSKGKARFIPYIHDTFKRSLITLFKELRKGQFVCCNCHQIRTLKRKQHKKIQYI